LDRQCILFKDKFLRRKVRARPFAPWHSRWHLLVCVSPD
jgi:hypothetical protein